MGEIFFVSSFGKGICWVFQKEEGKKVLPFRSILGQRFVFDRAKFLILFFALIGRTSSLYYSIS